ncbi:hypothetical protein [Roseospira goensis]|uniref:Uncharacterized protein n=1 Tax=Roseospira goensis TaxID=391922 RepID=A0A7W6S435_9PROT|nr:hypothetical protein [Roseospira goensis]MBB4287965.1 hypothetical protein [Roseospira goensis]
MTRYARIVADVAVDVTDADPATRYHPTVAAEFVAVPEDVRPGWRHDPDTDTWTAPPDPAPAPDPDPAPAVPTTYTPPQFMAALFTAPERIAIRAARETDPVVDDFLTLIEDPRLTEVDRTDPGTVQAIQYLTTTDPPLLTAARAAQVLAGARPDPS